MNHGEGAHKIYLIGREFVFLAALVVFIAAASWGLVEHYTIQEKSNIEKTLLSVLNTSHASIKNQLKSQKRSAQVWASSDQVQMDVVNLTKLRLDRHVLTNSTAQKHLRQWMLPLIDIDGIRGFFVIGAGNINLASSRNTNIGAVNLLPPGILERAWSGETVISLPQASDVPLQDINGNMVEHLATMFVVTPVKGLNKKTIALFALRIEPDQTFSPVFERSHFGDSGETYAFNGDAVLISESRYNAQLKRLGLVSGPHSDLRLEVRDPGVDLTEGASSALPRHQQPFTTMVKNAIAGKSGTNLDGYRDYRGVEVVGAWLWDSELNFGIATEITVDEAFNSFKKLRWVMGFFTVFSIGTLLALAAVFYRARTDIWVREDRFRRSLKYAVIGTWDWNIKTGNLIWSDMISPLFGYQHGAIEPNFANFLSVIHVDDRTLVTNAIEACIEGHKEFDIEHRVVWPDGTIHWVREKGDVQRTAQGKAIRVLGVISNIDVRKQSQENLALHVKELNFQKSALDEHAIVSITNVQGNIVYANKKFCEISGYSVDELIGQNHRIIKSDEHLPDVYTDLWKTISQGNVWQGELKNIKKNGEGYWVMSTIVPFMNDKGKPFQYISIRTDITTRKKAEMMAMTANRAKSDLMANMSHELRTPLNAIIGFSSTMKAEIFGRIESEKYREYIDDIHFSGEHLLALINDILDVSAIEAGALNLYQEHASLADIMKASIRLVGSRADQGEVTLSSTIDATCPVVYVDERRVKQVFLNLLSNAVKFTPEGGQVSASSYVTDDGGLAVTICDNGIGMNEDEIVTALSTFGQVDSGLNRKHEGTGLGLPLVAGLMKAHGGSLVILSQKNQGTQVTITFPKKCVGDYSLQSGS